MTETLEDFDPQGEDYLEHLEDIGAEDAAGLKKSQVSYGNSWKSRGGVGAFMMMARKWDRLENRVRRAEVNPEGISASPWDIFAHVEADPRSEGVIDDIRDLRRYLMLVEADLRARGFEATHRDNAPALTPSYNPTAGEVVVLEGEELDGGDKVYVRHPGVAYFRHFEDNVPHDIVGKRMVVVKVDPEMKRALIRGSIVPHGHKAPLVDRIWVSTEHLSRYRDARLTPARWANERHAADHPAPFGYDGEG